MNRTQTYLKNYWKLYLHFVQTFGGITYQGIPLALLSNFYRYLSPDLKKEMESDRFFRSAHDSVVDEHLPQRLIDKKMAEMVPVAQRRANGRLLLHLDYLRWTPEIFRQFDPQKTTALLRGSVKTYAGLPAINKNELYQPVPAHVLRQLENRIQAVFAALPGGHPVRWLSIKKTFLASLPAYLRSISGMRAAFDRQPISLIVLGTTEDTDSRVLALEGKRRHIPSVCLQHGLLMGEEAFFPVLATVQGVYGHYERNWYLAKGCGPRQVLITGHPRFDAIFQQASRHMVDGRELKRPGEKLILVAAQPNVEKALRHVLKHLLSMPGVRVAVKAHPLEYARNRLSLYQAFSHSERFQLLPKTTVLYDVLAQADGVVTLTSTVGLEGMLFGKPVWIVDNPNDRDYRYYQSLKTNYVPDAAALVSRIAAAFGDGRQLRKASRECEQFRQRNYPVLQSLPTLFRLFSQLTGKQFRRKVL
jgi:hypothetical protein